MTNVKKTIHGAGLATSVALALAACGGSSANAADPAMGAPKAGAVHCKESNSCKGNGSCAGVAVNEKHACKGQNACGGNLREVSKAECDAIKGTVVASKLERQSKSGGCP